MSRSLLLVCCSSTLAASGPAAAWLWTTLLAELATVAPGTVVLCGDDRAAEALAWAAATLVGLPRVSFRKDGSRRAQGIGGPKRWTKVLRPAHAARARALVTSARDAARLEGGPWSVQVVGFLGGKVTSQNETYRRLTMARAEKLSVREHLLPAEHGGCLIDLEAKAS